MDIDILIHKAFDQRKFWIEYFNINNDPQSLNKLDDIHKAETVSVGIMCINLKNIYGLKWEILYRHTGEIFNGIRPQRLSGVIDLSSIDSFVESLNTIEMIYRRSSDKVYLIN